MKITERRLRKMVRATMESFLNKSYQLSSAGITNNNYSTNTGDVFTSALIATVESDEPDEEDAIDEDDETPSE